MRSTRDIRICNVCGRLLDIGESCNCEQPIRGAPRDGLRAKCPLFKCRSCYRLQYYIVGECGNPDAKRRAEIAQRAQIIADYYIDIKEREEQNHA